MTKRFIEFMTQRTDDGELICGFKDIIDDKWYYTNDGKNAKAIVDLLNALHEENQRHHQILADMLQNERTQIGQSVLKQYKEAIE